MMADSRGRLNRPPENLAQLAKRLRAWRIEAFNFSYISLKKYLKNLIYKENRHRTLSLFFFCKNSFYSKLRSLRADPPIKFFFFFEKSLQNAVINEMPIFFFNAFHKTIFGLKKKRFHHLVFMCGNTAFGVKMNSVI